MTYAVHSDTSILGCTEFAPYLTAAAEDSPLSAVAARARAKCPLRNLLRRSPETVPADAALCTLIDSKANDREIIIWAFSLNALCWFGLLYSFGSF